MGFRLTKFIKEDPNIVVFLGKEKPGETELEPVYWESTKESFESLGSARRIDP